LFHGIDDPIRRIGAYFTGPGGTVQISFNDGTSELLTIPSLGDSGGVEYWGFTDTSAFSTITITDVSGDNFGIDGISFNREQLAPTPLPAALALFISGLGLMGFFGWRRKKEACGVR
jgi:PEP-CTERM motif